MPKPRASLPLLSAVALLVAACGGGGGGGPATASVAGELRVPEIPPQVRLEPEGDAQPDRRTPQSRSGITQPMRAGEVVVWLEPGVDPATLAQDGFELLRGGSGPLAVFRALAAAGKASVRAGAPAADSCEQATCDAAVTMASRTGVRCASANYLVQLTAGPALPPMEPPIEPNDPGFAWQWHYNQANVPQAWNLTTGSSDVIVAVLDTGVKANHPDFDPARFVDGYDMVTDPAMARDGNGRDADPDDPGDLFSPEGSSFHGTHVGGTIGASSANGLGVAGIDWSCKLMHVRVLGVGGGTIEDIGDGILYAARLQNGSGRLPARRADIINLSLGSNGLNPIYDQVCNAATAAGCLVVAAAGNDATAEPLSPAAAASVLSVGATDLVEARAPYSNFSDTIDIWAPGGDVSADRNGDERPDGVLSLFARDSGQLTYEFENGTSMACPHVAGIAALVKAANPALTAAQIRQILISTSRPVAGLPNNGRIVDALAAVTAAAGGPPTVPVLVATPAIVDFGVVATTVQRTVTIENRGAGQLTFVSLTANPTADWLAADFVDATAGNGLDLDSLTLQAERGSRPNGVYDTVVTIEYNDGSSSRTISLDARMQIGASTLPTDTLFVLLLDPSTFATRFQVDTDSARGFDWRFAEVPAGEYLLIAGTDRDNDDELGDDGELFGAYPDLDSLSRLRVPAGGNLSNLVFGLQSIGSGPALPASAPSRSALRPRRLR